MSQPSVPAPTTAPSTPAAPAPSKAADKQAEKQKGKPLLNSELGTFTHYANVVDMCGINVQAGTYQTSEGGVTLPFGITVLGGSGHDAKVFDIASVFEEASRSARKV